VKAACIRLKNGGYTIALDDFVLNDPRAELAKSADIIKLDVKTTSLEERAVILRRYGTSSCQMLAKRVETREEYSACKHAGFSYFQGYFSAGLSFCMLVRFRKIAPTT